MGGTINGNPLQCSCLENPRDRVAWWAAIYGVAQSQTRLKQLSSSIFFIGLPRWHSGKESACQCKRHRRWGFGPWVGKMPWRRKWQPMPVFLPRKSQAEEPDNLQSMESQRVRHVWACAHMHMRTHTHAYTHTHSL